MDEIIANMSVAGEGEIAEVVESEAMEIEPQKDSGGLIKATKENVEDVMYLADNIDKLIDAQNRIRLGILKLAQSGDWILFKGTGQDQGKAELGFAGANRIGSVLGVSFINWATSKESGKDALGDWYRYDTECDAVYRNRTVRVYGRASSRDKFLGKSGGQFRPLEQIDESNIKMIARRAAMKEGVKIMFGLHRMNPEYLKAHGIELVNVGGYEFKSNIETKSNPEIKNNSQYIVFDARLEKSGKTSKGNEWNLYGVSTDHDGHFRTFSKSQYETALKAMELKKPVTIVFKDEKGYKNIESIEIL